MKSVLFRSSLYILIASFALAFVPNSSSANENACAQVPSVRNWDKPFWKTSAAMDLKYIVSWEVYDPAGCVIGIGEQSQLGHKNIASWNFPEQTVFIPTTWRVLRDGDRVFVSAELEFPISLLQSMPNKNLDGLGVELSQLSQKVQVWGDLVVRKGTGTSVEMLRGTTSLAHLWGDWFSKKQGIFPTECQPLAVNYNITSLNPKIGFTVISRGKTSLLEITIEEKSNCIFLVHAGPLQKPLGLNRIFTTDKSSLAEIPFLNGEASAYFDQILGKPNQLLQVAAGNFTGESKRGGWDDSDATEVLSLPTKLLSHSDTVERDGHIIKVRTSINLSDFSGSEPELITVYVGFYWWYDKDGSYVPSNWRVSFNGNSWTATWRPGATLPGGKFIAYTTRAIRIPVSSLISADATITKTESSVQENNQESERQNFNQDVLAEVTASLNKLVDSMKKKKTIICVNGQKTLKISNFKPKCPKGYKERKK